MDTLKFLKGHTMSNENTKGTTQWTTKESMIFFLELAQDYDIYKLHKKALEDWAEDVFTYRDKHGEVQFSFDTKTLCYNEMKSRGNDIILSLMRSNEKDAFDGREIEVDEEVDNEITVMELESNMCVDSPLVNISYKGYGIAVPYRNEVSHIYSEACEIMVRFEKYGLKKASLHSDAYGCLKGSPYVIDGWDSNEGGEEEDGLILFPILAEED